jgi:uncharacterized coiled-coil DUF342 family protein
MKINLFCIGLSVLLLMAGCRVIEERVIYETTDPQPSATPSQTAQPNAEILERRFVDPDKQNDAVQSAVTWAQKYEKMVEQNTELREQYNRLFVENTELKQQLTQTKTELERTRKELNEANEFLQEMHVELNKWKADVLGFRDEMRQAQKAQLEALSRILLILGAEPMQTSPRNG